MKRSAAALLLLLASAGPAAATVGDTTAATVSMTVNPNCIVSATNLAFGSYNPLSPSPTDGASTLQIRCTYLTVWSIKLNQGTGSGATISQRRMTRTASPPSGTLTYSLYTDAARIVLWGDGLTGVSAVGSGTGSWQTVNVYGRIPTGQFTAAGSYSDTISVTVNY
ncbi:spore coat U domain-containing protein [Zavarzinia sp.]|uniref:Csu type fimbrial protein n=1 Tax=Zavarzinia sp. TaxID=2027920 RepID=UPI003562C737